MKRHRDWIIAYVIVGHLCFGWAYNHMGPQMTTCGQSNFPCDMRGFKSVVAGVIWPIWAGGSLALAVTKWP
jgi:hypothetical protein